MQIFSYSFDSKFWPIDRFHFKLKALYGVKYYCNDIKSSHDTVVLLQ